MSYTDISEVMREVDKGNYENARKMLEPLRDNTNAQLQLAYLCQMGLGGAKEIEKATAIYTTLANAGDSQGAYYLGALLLERNQLDQALHCFEMASGLDHVSGAYWAAALNDGYRGYPINAEKAAKYYEQASRLGHYFAKRDLARLNMKKASNFLEWAIAASQYLRAKIVGTVAVVRNPHDLRLR